jgi:hypothetical protein
MNGRVETNRAMARTTNPITKYAASNSKNWYMISTPNNKEYYHTAVLPLLMIIKLFLDKRTYTNETNVINLDK